MGVGREVGRDGRVDGRFFGRGGSLKMGVDSGGWGQGGGAGSLLSSFSFFSFFSLGLIWMGGFQSQGRPKHNLFLGRKEEWRGEKGAGRKKPVMVATSFALLG